MLSFSSAFKKSLFFLLQYKKFIIWKQWLLWKYIEGRKLTYQIEMVNKQIKTRILGPLGMHKNNRLRKY